MKIQSFLAAVLLATLAACGTAGSNYSVYVPLASQQAHTALASVVPDSRVDSVIDPRLSPSEHALIKEILLTLAPNQRGNGVIVETEDGMLHASSLELLKYAQSRRAKFVKAPHFPSEPPMRSSIESPISSLDPAAACPEQSLGGYGTGPFRRVYIGCMGYAEQTIDFVDNYCNISDSLETGNDLHGVYAGAYIPGSNGVDAGLVYVNEGAPPNNQYWELYGLVSGNPPIVGATIPCGAGKYQITLEIQSRNSTQNEFILSASGGSTSHVLSPLVVLSSQFPTDGSTFVFRRLTAIAQQTQNLNSQEWFGFDENSAGGPDLSHPRLWYTASTVCCGANGPTQVQFIAGTSENAYSERYPAAYTNTTGVICGHDSEWQSPGNFNDYEGVNLSNPDASGTFPYTNCGSNSGGT